MVLLFKGIAPPSQFPATIASGSLPRPDHACFQGKVDVCFETRWRSWGVCTTRTTSPPPKKSSLRALRAHNVRTYTSGTSCADRRRVPFMGCFSSGSQNMGDGSGGAQGGKQRRSNSACPRDHQSGCCLRWTYCVSDGLFSLWPQEERLAASGLLPASRWTSTVVSDNPPP